MNRIRAIPEEYPKGSGRWYRSRTEARWAVFFDLAEIPFFYEPERYAIAYGKAYLPDFWLPLAKVFLEIKGPAPNADAMDKAEKLCIEYKENVCIAVGDPYETIEAHWFGFCSWSKAPFSPADVVDGKAVSHHVDDEKHEMTPYNIKAGQILSIDEDGLYTYVGPQHGAGLSWCWYSYGVDVDGGWVKTIIPNIQKFAFSSKNERTGEVSGSRFFPGYLERYAMQARNWRFW